MRPPEIDRLLSSEIEKTARYALVSVSDKTGLVDLARVLKGQGYRIISTGGTAKTLADGGISVIPIQNITGNPESFDGRMKTISFQVESGILYDRTNPEHVRQAQELGVKRIDVVVCNLYPFEQTIAKPGVSFADAVENIDVGGPTMVRAAAKNFKNVLVVIDPGDYQRVAEALEKGQVTDELRQELAAKAFTHLSFYDSQVARYLNREAFPLEVTLPGRKVFDLRYGENPHQRGALYIEPNTNSPLGQLKRRAGRPLSEVNVTDINAGLESVRLFAEPVAVVIKHNSPCGIALGKTVGEALMRAIEADPESAFGGVVVLNRPFDLKAARVIASFKEERRSNMDIVAAPEISEEALQLLQEIRRSTRVYTFGEIPAVRRSGQNIKWIDGGFILQDHDDNVEGGFKNWVVVTDTAPNAVQLLQMRTAWKFVTKVRSNAVIVVDGTLPMTRGIGSGQTSRFRATKLALEQAGEYARGAILASDSFFPFDDSVTLAAKEHGIGAIIQQGESVNDRASIEAANRAGIPMVFTHRRAFWH